MLPKSAFNEFMLTNDSPGWAAASKAYLRSINST
jgi:hypothetical protein